MKQEFSPLGRAAGDCWITYRDGTEADGTLLVDQRGEAIPEPGQSEARSLGLDQHDTVVRRRLAQKLTFIVEDTLRIADPSEDELRRFYSVHGAAYRTEPRVSFSHIFFSPQRRSEALAEATAALLRASASGDVESDPIPLDANYVDVEEAVVTSLFGAEKGAIGLRLIDSGLL